MKRTKLIALLLCGIFLFFAFYTSCSSSDYADDAYEEALDMPMEQDAENGKQTGPSMEKYTEDGSVESSEENNENLPSERKIIRNASLQIQTEDYEASIASVENLIGEYGGYIQNQSSSGAKSSSYSSRCASYTARIPAEKLDAFLHDKDSIGTVTDSQIWQEDVSDSYFDQESRLTALRTKEERLLSILEKATELTDIIELENALSDTIYEIESITGSLRRLDSLIEYSTVNISIEEVIKVDTVRELPKTLGERISAKFSDTIEGLGEFGEDILVVLIGGFPVILLIAVIVIVILLIIRAVKKKRKKKLIAKAQKIEKARIEAEKRSKENKT